MIRTTNTQGERDLTPEEEEIYNARKNDGLPAPAPDPMQEKIDSLDAKYTYTAMMTNTLTEA